MPHQQPNQPNSIERRRKVISLITEAQQLAELEGIRDIFRPGFIKEMIVGDVLGHRLCSSWRDGSGDAYDPRNPEQRFEYFTAPEGRRFQAGLIRRHDWQSKKSAFMRFTNAAAVYLAVFDPREPLKLVRIYLIETEVFRTEIDRQVKESKSSVINASFSERWASTAGRLIFPAPGSGGRPAGDLHEGG